MSLNLNWYKSYDTKRKNSKSANLCSWTKLQKNRDGNIFVLCYNFWTNQNLGQLRPVKHVKMTFWTSVLWKMNIHIAKKWPEMVVTWSFIKGQSFPISLYKDFCPVVWHSSIEVLHLEKKMFYLEYFFSISKKSQEKFRKYFATILSKILQILGHWFFFCNLLFFRSMFWTWFFSGSQTDPCFQ